MVLPQTLPLISDFKKEYKFLWCIIGEWPNYFNNMSRNLNSLAYDYILHNVPYCLYVSQLAERVDIPDDEFDVENVDVGPVTYQMPKRIKMNNITVTYLEDTLNSVYNFHKAWFNLIRGGNSFYMNSPCSIYASARYIEFDDTLTASEYMAMAQISNGLSNALGEKAGDLKTLIAKLEPAIPIHAKPTGITTYPRVYPVKIQRSAANHSGNGLAKVTVTYARLPDIKRKHAYLEYMTAEDQWSPIGDNNSRFFGM